MIIELLEKYPQLAPDYMPAPPEEPPALTAIPSERSATSSFDEDGGSPRFGGDLSYSDATRQLAGSPMSVHSDYSDSAPGDSLPGDSSLPEVTPGVCAQRLRMTLSVPGTCGASTSSVGVSGDESYSGGSSGVGSSGAGPSGLGSSYDAGRSSPPGLCADAAAPRGARTPQDLRPDHRMSELEAAVLSDLVADLSAPLAPPRGRGGRLPPETVAALAKLAMHGLDAQVAWRWWLGMAFRGEGLRGQGSGGRGQGEQLGARSKWLGSSSSA